MNTRQRHTRIRQELSVTVAEYEQAKLDAAHGWMANLDHGPPTREDIAAAKAWANDQWAEYLA